MGNWSNAQGNYQVTKGSHFSVRKSLLEFFEGDDFVLESVHEYDLNSCWNVVAIFRIDNVGNKVIEDINKYLTSLPKGVKCEMSVTTLLYGGYK